ncbi:MAG: DUF11 domain-containing protein [Candidatus Promineofilum sp.]|nr:DUF11 domain-containing protein [Promineifilum sp.]
MASTTRAFDAPVQVFYITEPEGDVLPAMGIINSAAVSPMVTKISIAISSANTLVYYDHWENGFANDIANPTVGEIYASPGNLGGVQIWGDGNTANGAPPGFPGDLLNSGNVIILEDNSVVVPNLATTIDWDGKDKIGATNAVAVSRSLWASGSNSLFAWANAMYPTTEWGQTYTAPVGCNTSSGEMFDYTAFSITAAYDGTTVQVDPEGDGTWETSQSLDEGDTYFDASSSGFGCPYIRQGGKVRSTDPAKPIQVVLLTGDIGSTYASRDINLFADTQLTSSYWIPVGNNTSAGATRLFIYNPEATTLYVKCEKPASSIVLTIAAGAVNSDFTLADDQGAHCFAVTSAAGTTADTSRKFSGLATIDTYAAGRDWAVVFIPESGLTNQALVGLGVGRDWTSATEPLQNGSPLWVTPTCQTFFYVDWNNDGTPDKVDFNGDNDVADTNVNGLNETTSNTGFQVSSLRSVRLFDASDRDQTGAYIFTKTVANNGGTGGCTFAAAWGEDPRTASIGSPGLDLGTSIVSLRAVQASKASALLIDADSNGTLSPGDTLQYLITIKNTGFSSVLVSVKDTIPANTTYVGSSTYKDVGSGWVAISDDGSGTPFPLDALPNGVSLGTLPPGTSWKVRFNVTVNSIPAGTPVQIQNCAIITYDSSNVTVCVTEDVLVPAVPGISVDKTANPLTVPETGGNVTYTFVVNNTGNVPLTITSLTDNKFGTLAGDADCKIGTVLPVPGSCSFSQVFAVPAGTAGGTHVNTFTANGTGNSISVTDDDPATVTYTDVLPSIIVDKVANPLTVPETGGNVTFTFTVTNNGTVPVTISSLADNKFGTLVGDADCKVGTALAPAASCTFDATFAVPAGTAGGTHVNTFTAKAKDAQQNEATDDDPATVTYTDVLPSIIVDKVANPTSVPETGGNVTFTFTVTNNGTVPVTISSLADNKFGTLAGDADCKVGTALAPAASCTFDATFAVPAGTAGGTHVNTFTAKAKDAQQNEATDDDPATVTYTDVLPSIIVDKVANPLTVPETGGNVTFTFTVTNNGTVPVTISSLADNKFGTLVGDADCKVGTALAPAASCTFDATFAVPAGAVGSNHVNTFTAKAKDAQQNEATDDDPATVTYTDVLPSIVVDKVANPTSVPETGGNVTFTFTVTNNGTVPVTISSLADDKFGTLVGDADCKVGTALAPAASCTFDATFAVPAGAVGSNHVNTFTAKAKDAQQNEATDDDPATVTYADVLPSIVVDKVANPTSVLQTGGNVTFTYVVTNNGTVPVTISSLADDKFGTLAGDADCKVGTALAPAASCTFDATFAVPAGAVGSNHVNTFTAKAKDAQQNEATDDDPATVTYADVLPSIVVDKVANPTSVLQTGGNVTFTYVVTNNGTVPVTISSLADDKFGTLAGDADCKVGTALAPAASCTFDATFAVPAGAVGSNHVNTFMAKAVDAQQNEATATDDAEVTYTDVLPDISVTKTANPTSVPETGGPVTFTYVVTNNATEPATITSLTDDKFGTLAGDADCQVGTVLAANGGSCTFDALFNVPAGNYPGSHTNVFTAKAEDPDGNESVADDPEEVTYTDVLPSIIVDKVANPTSVPETGGNVTFTFTVTNNGTVPVTISSLADDKFGTLAGDGDCKVGTALAPAASCTFDATFAVPAGAVGSNHVNTFTAKAKDAQQNEATDDDPATVTYADVLPSITVTKTANPTSVLQTGGNVTFTYVVTNNGTVPVTISSLADDKFGTLAGDGDCQVGTPLAPAASCTFEATFAVPAGAVGSSHVNTFTAKAVDAQQNEVTATDDAEVTYTDVLPDISVTKTANPTSVPETGGPVTFTYVVTNNATEPATITSLTDDKFGTLAGDADCQVGTVLAANGGSCTFDALFNVPAGDYPGSHTNVFTAKAEDPDGNESVADDPEEVIYTDVLPDISVTKSADPASVPETGGNVTFTFVVTNNATEPATITSLADDKYGTLAGDADCKVGTVLAAGGGSCTFSASFLVPPGTSGSKHTNVFTTTAEDDDGNKDTASDPADVTYTDVKPSIVVTKTANPTSVPQAGGPVTFTYVVTNNGPVSITITSLMDNKFGTLVGDADCKLGTPLAANGGSCTFDAIFNVPAGTYPGSHVNIFTAKAKDADNNEVMDDDDAIVLYQQPPVVNVCPVTAADNRWTDILGVGMGNPKKHKPMAKVVIPNSGNVVELYGQMAAKNQGSANFVRFMLPGKNNYVEVHAIDGPPSHSASVFWYGTELEPTTNVRGRWFLQKSGTQFHIPRALLLYPTYQTAQNMRYVNVFELLQPSDTQVYWDIAGGWVPQHQVTINIPAPLARTTFTIKVALVDNDLDARPIYVTASAGGVSQTLAPTGPNLKDQLNILVFTLQNVPAGSGTITLTIESPQPFTNGLDQFGGDSGALVGVTANYFCQEVTGP